MKKSIVFLLVVIIIAIVVILIIKKLPSQPLVVEDNAVVVGDQKPGESVVVHYVKLEKPGFVTLHRGTNQQAVGTSALLTSGEHFDVSVTVDGGTKTGDAITATLSFDDGDGEYDATKDSVVSEVDGTATIDENASDVTDLGMEAEADGYTLLEEEVIVEDEPAVSETTGTQSETSTENVTGTETTNDTEETPAGAQE